MPGRFSFESVWKLLRKFDLSQRSIANSVLHRWGAAGLGAAARSGFGSAAHAKMMYCTLISRHILPAKFFSEERMIVGFVDHSI